MPDPSTPQESRAGSAQSSDTEPPVPGDDADTAEQSETEVFTNRAARRARGKGSAQPPTSGKGKQISGQGAVQSPRQYGTRRSG
ncbi:MAG TPA: hypothetical protein VK453_05985 [Micromonosporaceae bacterium]|nr:hypothetical protein [Micromonosporaceae bacterium]